VRSALDGKRVGLFTYGGTGSGKTYTIGAESGGTPENDGILPRLLETLMNAGVALSYKVIEIVPGWDATKGRLTNRMIDMVQMKQTEMYTKDEGGVVTIVQGAPIYSPFDTSKITKCGFQTEGIIDAKSTHQVKMHKNLSAFESHTRLTAHSGTCIDTNLAFWVFSQFWAFTPFLALLPKSLPRTRLPSLFIYTCCFTHTCILPLVVPVHLRRR
jgi:hypothetical protein